MAIRWHPHVQQEQVFSMLHHNTLQLNTYDIGCCSGDMLGQGGLPHLQT